MSNDFDGATHPLAVRHGVVLLLMMVDLLLLLLKIAASVVADAAAVAVAAVNCSVSDAVAPDEKQVQQQQQQQQPSQRCVVVEPLSASIADSLQQHVPQPESAFDSDAANADVVSLSRLFRPGRNNAEIMPFQS